MATAIAVAPATSSTTMSQYYSSKVGELSEVSSEELHGLDHGVNSTVVE